MFDIKRARAEAAKEIAEEQGESAKKKIKTKMRELAQARKLVKNVERELEDLEDELSQDV